MERLGTRAAVICTTTFEGLAARSAQALGMADLPLLVVRHPLGGLQADEVLSRSREVTDRLAAVTDPGTRPPR